MIDTIIEENINIWYDCLSDCYQNNMRFDMIADYLDAITDSEAMEVI